MSFPFAYFVLGGKDFEDSSDQIHPSLCLLLVVPHHTVSRIPYHGDVSWPVYNQAPGLVAQLCPHGVGGWCVLYFITYQPVIEAQLLAVLEMTMWYNVYRVDSVGSLRATEHRQQQKKNPTSEILTLNKYVLGDLILIPQGKQEIVINSGVLRVLCKLYIPRRLAAEPF